MPVDLSFLRSESAQRLRAEGFAEGFAERFAHCVVLLLERHGIAVPDSARERICACRDQEVLDSWLRRAVSAVTVEDVFDEG